jgi:hypothetical protein
VAADELSSSDFDSAFFYFLGFLSKRFSSSSFGSGELPKFSEGTLKVLNG